MPSKEVEDKAVKLLKGNLVALAGTARCYDIGIEPNSHRVYVGEDKQEASFFQCDCEHGRHRGVNQDVDNACSHAIAALTVDGQLMQRVRRAMHERGDEVLKDAQEKVTRRVAR